MASRYFSIMSCFIITLLFPPFITATDQTPAGLSLPRSVPNPQDVLKIDDMPTCLRERCAPLDASRLSCPEPITRDCYCNSLDPISCIYNSEGESTCPDKDTVEAMNWLALTCTGLGYESIEGLPECAAVNIDMAHIYLSCDKGSWDCLCDVGILPAYLDTCSAEEVAITNAWKEQQCAKVGSSVGTAATTSAVVSASAVVLTYTSAGETFTATSSPTATVTKSGSFKVTPPAIIRLILGVAAMYLSSIVLMALV